MGVRGLSFYTPRNAPKTNTLFLLSEKRLLPLPSAVFPFPSLNNKYRYQLSNQILKVISNNGILFLMGASLNMKYAKIQFILYALSFEPLLPHCVCVLPLGPFSQNYAVLVQFAALKRRSMKFLTSCKGFSHGWASASAKATKIVQCSKESPAQKNDKCFEKKYVSQ